MGLTVPDLGYRVFMMQVYVLGFTLQGLGCAVSGCRLQGSGLVSDANECCSERVPFEASM